MFTNKKDQLLGATMVGSHASEQIGQYVVAMNHDLRMKDLADAMMPYPTYATASKIVAEDYMLEKMLSREHVRNAIKTARFLRR